MLDRIVVPLDLGWDSWRAVDWAEELGRRGVMPVELLSVMDPLRRDELEPLLTERAARSNGTTQVRTIESVAHAETVLAEELMADPRALWCVATHARGTLGEALFGSCSEQLVRVARGPVVMVGPEATAPPAPGVLAVAVDGSKPCEAMLSSAVDFARRFGMSLRLLHVADQPPRRGSPDGRAADYLQRLAAQIRSIEPVEFDVVQGRHPATALAEYLSTQPEIGMVAVATRAPSGMLRLWHGSTALELAHRSSVPVVMYHRDPIQAEDEHQDSPAVSTSTTPGPDRPAVRSAEDEWTITMEPLSVEECWDAAYSATASSIGRVAFVNGDGQQLLPLNFGVARRSIVVRTQHGSKLERLGTNRTAATFEVDHIDPGRHTGWSVMIQGRFSPIERPEEIIADDGLQLHPWAPGDRDCWLRLLPTAVTGRTISRRRATHPTGPLPNMAPD